MLLRNSYSSKMTSPAAYFELNGLRLRFDLPALFTKVCKHAGGQFGSGARTQTDDVFGAELMHIEHVCIVQKIPTQMN